jgi:hypothetical protein
LAELEEKISRKFTNDDFRESSRLDGCNSILWIERLLQTPLSDYRKLAIWRVLAPYLLNIRGISPHEAFGIMHDWLDKCNQVKRLDFNHNLRIKSVISSSKDFFPVSCEKLKAENEGFYNLLQGNGVLM